MANEKTHKNSYLIRRFAPYFKPYRWVLVFDLFCASLTTVCELVLPLIIQYLTDKSMDAAQQLTVSAIVWVGALYCVLRVIDALANYYMASTGHIMGAKIETDMRRHLFDHFQTLPHSYYDNTKIGQLMARVTSDLFDVTEFAHHCPEEFFMAFLKISIAFVILLRMNVWLTLLIFAVLPLMFVCVKGFNKRMRRTFKQSREQIGEINAQVEDSLLGIRVVKSFANEDIERQKFERGNNLFLTIKKKSYYYMAGFHTTTRLFDGLMYILVVVVGALFLMQSFITAGEYMAYLLYVTTLLNSIRRIVEFTEQFQRGMTGVERFIEVMDTPSDITDAPGAKNLTNVKGEVVFENVSFAYGEQMENVLTHINLRVKPGENIALVGPSGGGKTTLCHLIPRFYEVDSGRILIDNQDIKTLTLRSLRSQIGVVQQDVFLFSGTVLENIAYGKPGATHQEIEQAAKQAGAHEFISQLANGYDTYIGERGVKLSGGQKQRISIARAFLKSPPILILDEATSSLDSESERQIQQSLELLAKGRTTFTVAHRLSTIKHADTILVITDAGIAEQGTHEQLLAKKGIYYDLYQAAE